MLDNTGFMINFVDQIKYKLQIWKTQVFVFPSEKY